MIVIIGTNHDGKNIHLAVIEPALIRFPDEAFSTEPPMYKAYQPFETF